MHIRSLVLAGALCGATVAYAADVVETTKETVTTYRGTVSRIVPGSSTIEVRSTASADPVQYVYTERTTFVDAAGNVVGRETIANKPVTVYYTQDGTRTTVNKVVIENADGTVTERTETETVR
jgi:hypothetical protein